MVSPLPSSPDPFDPTTDDLRSSRVPYRRRPPVAAAPPPDATAGNDDLQRLESSVQWLMRQGAISRLETERRTREENRRLPRVTLLPPVPGIPPVDTEGSGRQADTSTFRLTPPLPFERLQSPRRRRRHSVRGALCLLIASMIAGSIAYHTSARGAFSAWQPARASVFDRNAGGLSSPSQNHN
jgi:hypothetical protein